MGDAIKSRARATNPIPHPRLRDNHERLHACDRLHGHSEASDESKNKPKSSA